MRGVHRNSDLCSEYTDAIHVKFDASACVCLFCIIFVAIVHYRVRKKAELKSLKIAGWNVSTKFIHDGSYQLNVFVIIRCTIYSKHTYVTHILIVCYSIYQETNLFVFFCASDPKKSLFTFHINEKMLVNNALVSFNATTLPLLLLLLLILLHFHIQAAAWFACSLHCLCTCACAKTNSMFAKTSYSKSKDIFVLYTYINAYCCVWFSYERWESSYFMNQSHLEIIYKTHIFVIMPAFVQFFSVRFIYLFSSQPKIWMYRYDFILIRYF